MINIMTIQNLVKDYQGPKEDNGLYGTVHVLKRINLNVKEKEFIAIMGKSGCGKTTLLKILGLIEPFTSGNIYLKEREITSISQNGLSDIRRRQIGFIFQDYYLLNHFSVYENIAFPLMLENVDEKEIDRKTREVAKRFEIDSLLKKRPYQLSGGEKQRVAISRAIINNPDFILADEPTGNLDAKTTKIVIDLLSELNQVDGKTIIMVTHDPQIACYCTRVVFINDGVVLKSIERSGEQSQFYEKILQYMRYM